MIGLQDYPPKIHRELKYEELSKLVMHHARCVQHKQKQSS